MFCSVSLVSDYLHPPFPSPCAVVYAAISSASLSILSTGVDSVFDLGSNILLFYMHRKAARLDVNKWPVGGSRLDPIANIIYGTRRPSPLFVAYMMTFFAQGLCK